MSDRLDVVQGSMSHSTDLIQIYTDNPEDGPRMISDKNVEGIPLMILIDESSCPHIKMNIPDGMICIE